MPWHANSGGTVHNTINITASNVTLDLSGFAVTNNASCTISSVSPATTCTPSSTDGSALIFVSGHNVTIKNGFVTGSYGDGIATTTLALGDLNLTLSDMVISESVSDGIRSGTSSGLTLKNVRVYKNGGDGIVTYADAMFDHVSSNWNNGLGISVISGILSDIVTNGNGGVGVAQYGGLNGGVLSNVNATSNGGTGVYTGGMVVNSGSFGGNLGVGLISYGALTTNVVGEGNNGSQSASQFTFDVYSCYINAAVGLGSIGGTGKNGSAVTGCQ